MVDTHTMNHKCTHDIIVIVFLTLEDLWRRVLYTSLLQLCDRVLAVFVLMEADIAQGIPVRIAWLGFR